MIKNMTVDELIAAHENEGVNALVDANGLRYEVEGNIAHSSIGPGLAYVEVSLGVLYIDADATYDVEM